MIVKFTPEQREPEKPTLDDVETDQFFVDHFGRLCQKIHQCSYNTITDKNGKPCSGTVSGAKGCEIKKILPEVTKIEY